MSAQEAPQMGAKDFAEPWMGLGAASVGVTEASMALAVAQTGFRVQFGGGA